MEKKVGFRLSFPKPIKDFFIATLLFFIFYRIFFFIKSYTQTYDYFLFRLTAIPLGLFDDIIIIMCSIIFLLVTYLILKVITTKFLNIIFEIIAFLTFVCITVLYLINANLYSLLFIGLNYTILLTCFYQGKSLLSYTPFINFSDQLILLFVLSSYVAIKYLSNKRVKQLFFYIMLPTAYSLLITGALLYMERPIVGKTKRFYDMYISPITLIGQTYLASLNEYNNKKFPLANAQIQAMKIYDPDFLTLQSAPAMSAKQATEKLNIVIFVLESVSLQYIFEPVAKQIPMPFLKQLAKKGVWFENNYSGGNISPTGQFSIFTGLYPNPSPQHFELQDTLNIPTIASWLGKNYHSFLVNASGNIYFSTGLNKTIHQYYNVKDINPDTKQSSFNIFFEEYAAHNFFLEKLDKSQQPFLAIYWSCATHYPYNDYSHIVRINNDIEKAYARYQNNLRLLDMEIEKTYRLLAKKDLLNKTIFIVIGDHGEIFSNRGNLSVHGRSLFEEEIKVPLLIYAPKLLAPAIIHQATSSIDILPTVLDLGKIPYTNVQGESLLSHINKRKYIFIYNDQDEIASIDQHKQKMRISFANANCAAYDLNRDPKELQSLPCSNQQQKQAILKFRNYQPQILEKYNEANNAR